MSHVTCHMLNVICYMKHVKCHKLPKLSRRPSRRPSLLGAAQQDAAAPVRSYIHPCVYRYPHAPIYTLMLLYMLLSIPSCSCIYPRAPIYTLMLLYIPSCLCVYPRALVYALMLRRQDAAARARPAYCVLHRMGGGEQVRRPADPGHPRRRACRHELRNGRCQGDAGACHGS